MGFATRRQPQRRPRGHSTHAYPPRGAESDGIVTRASPGERRRPRRSRPSPSRPAARYRAATGGTVAPVPMDTPATDTAADTPDGEAETLAVTVKQAQESLPYRHEPWRSFRRRRPLRPASPSHSDPGCPDRARVPPFPPLPPLPPLGPGGGRRGIIGRRGRAGHTRSRRLGHARRDHRGGARTATARQPPRLGKRHSYPRDSHDPFGGSTTSALSAAPTRAPKRLGRAEGCECELPSASPGISDSTPRSTSDGSEKGPVRNHQEWNEQRSDSGERCDLAAVKPQAS